MMQRAGTPKIMSVPLELTKHELDPPESRWHYWDGSRIYGQERYGFVRAERIVIHSYSWSDDPAYNVGSSHVRIEWRRSVVYHGETLARISLNFDSSGHLVEVNPEVTPYLGIRPFHAPPHDVRVDSVEKEIKRFLRNPQVKTWFELSLAEIERDA